MLPTRLNHKLFVLAVSLFATACLANLFVPAWIGELSPYNFREQVGMFAAGFLVSEFALLGLLLAYWKAHIVQRFFTTAVALLVITACWMITLTDFGNEPIPINIYAICLALGTIGVFLQSFVLVLLRWWYMRQRRKEVEANAAQASLKKQADHSHRYGLTFIVFLMSACALAILLQRRIQFAEQEPFLREIIFTSL